MAKRNKSTAIKRGRTPVRKIVPSFRKKGIPLCKARKGQKGNPADAAAKLYEQFHGRPSTGHVDYKVAQHYHQDLAKLGKLIWLKVETLDGRGIEIKPRDVLCCSSEDGGQLYLVGGDQSMDLAAAGVEESGLPKDHVCIGWIWEINYHTKKAFHNFEPIDYVHQFGEDGGMEPLLCYDVRSSLLYIVGGTYKVKRAGIEN